MKMLNQERLAGLHPDLISLITSLNASGEAFAVIEGMRTFERQKWLLKEKKTTTLNSRHLTGHAIDIAPVVNGKVSWDWKDFHSLETAMKRTSREKGIPIEWGGDWKSFKDGAHWQLPWKEYPVTAVNPVDLAAARAAVDELNAKLATTNVDATPTVKGKTNGFKSSEFWMTLAVGAVGILDQMAGSGLLAAFGPVGIAYVIGRPVLKSVLVAAEAYVNGKQVKYN
jgi:peptidoglycan L-alanyl-D-glutamate endopeptidase CwlK